MAQILLYQFDEDGNFAMLISPEFNIEGLTAQEYRSKIRNLMNDLLYKAIRANNITLPTAKVHCPGPRGRRLEPDLSLKGLFKIFEEHHLHIEFFRGSPQDEGFIKLLNLEDFDEEPLDLDQILQNFDDWAKELRNNLIERYNRGQVPVGTSFDMAETIEYYTEFPMGLPNGAERYLHAADTENGQYFGEL